MGKVLIRLVFSAERMPIEIGNKKQTFPGKFVLFGGVHASFIPETTIEEKSIDAVFCVA